MFVKSALFLLTAFMLLASPTRAVASLKVDPFVVYIVPGSATSAVVELTNVTDIDLPFEMSVEKRVVVDGKEERVAADDDFVLFPYQAIIPKGSTQTLRMQWLPNETTDRSQSYYVYVTQVPAEISPGVSGIRINYQFGVSVHIVPQASAPDVVIRSVRAAEKDGKQGVELDVENVGTRYARMSEQELIVGGATVLDRNAIKSAIGAGFLLPGQSNSYFLPLSAPTSDLTSARLRYLGPP